VLTHTYPAVGVYTRWSPPATRPAWSCHHERDDHGTPVLTITKDGRPPPWQASRSPTPWRDQYRQPDGYQSVHHRYIPAGAAYVGGGMSDGQVVSWTVASLRRKTTSRQFVVTATQTITNSDYRVSARTAYRQRDS